MQHISVRPMFLKCCRENLSFCYLIEYKKFPMPIGQFFSQLLKTNFLYETIVSQAQAAFSYRIQH